RDLFKIQPLGHHLGTEQNIIFLAGKPAKHSLMGVFLHGGILVHPQNARRWQQVLKFFFHPLGAEAAINKLAAALWAACRRRAELVPAMMAEQRLPVLVVDERYATVWTF